MNPYVNFTRASRIYLTVHKKDLHKHPRKSNISRDTSDIVTSSSLIVQWPRATLSNTILSERCESNSFTSTKQIRL